jgi:hypothetical protein
MESGGAVDYLSLEVVYDDEHLIQVECRIAVRGWSGVARAYTTQDDLQTFAEVARRFGETSQGQGAWEAGADNSIGMVACDSTPLTARDTYAVMCDSHRRP